MYLNSEKGIKVDDATAIKAILAGDKAAFRNIVRMYEKRLYGIIYRIVHSQQDAEDIMQGTFLAAYNKLNTFKGDSSLFTWLVAIAYNNIRQYMRKQRWQRCLSLEVDILDIENKSVKPDKLEKEELGIILQNALIKLPLKLRTVLMLYEVEELEHKTIA